MRSLLFVPGSSARMMAKAAASGTDVVIYDLEDAVHPERKEAARPLVAAALASPSGPGPLRYVRVNALGTPWCEGDLEAVLPAGPDGIVLPKVTEPEDLDRLDALIGRWEAPAKVKATRIVAVCTETPEATLSLAARSWKHPRLAGLLWGGEDLSAAIDAVFTNFRNSEELARETDAARRDGFTAKAAIHPAQIEIINARFTPTETERRWAERVIAAFAASGSNVVQLDGVMLDAPHLTQARRIMKALQP
jgi:citrate lyase subunit beta/citryl-CoA lyase